jgi:hypothetical protein
MEGVTVLGPSAGMPRAALWTPYTPRTLGHSSMWRGWRYGLDIIAFNRCIVHWVAVIWLGRVYIFTVQRRIDGTLAFFHLLTAITGSGYESDMTGSDDAACVPMF